ncbi:hypothetical protein DFH06DRAFT_748981 [Mycena polygramma]|nr:hypothetical protein DFH06DRAFT_748981 [Mycena polygramma]
MTMAVLVHTRLPTRSLRFPASLSPFLSPNGLFPPPSPRPMRPRPRLPTTRLILSRPASPRPLTQTFRMLDTCMALAASAETTSCHPPGGIIDGINAPGSDAKVDRSLAMWCLPRRVSPRTAGCINSVSVWITTFPPTPSRPCILLAMSHSLQVLPVKLSVQTFLWRRKISSTSRASSSRLSIAGWSCRIERCLS